MTYSEHDRGRHVKYLTSLRSHIRIRVEWSLHDAQRPHEVIPIERRKRMSAVASCTESLEPTLPTYPPTLGSSETHSMRAMPRMLPSSDNVAYTLSLCLSLYSSGPFRLLG